MNATDFLKRADDEIEDTLSDEWHEKVSEDEMFGLKPEYFEELVQKAREVYAEKGGFAALRFVKDDSPLNLLDAKRFVNTHCE